MITGLEIPVICYSVDSIKELLESKFSKVVDCFDGMESFPELVTELDNAIGSYSSTVRNIKSGENDINDMCGLCLCLCLCVRA